MDLKQSQQIRKYIDIILRRKALIIAFLLLGVAVGLILTVITPKEYRATALLSYQEQKVNPAKMSPDVQAKIRDMVSTLSQIVTSRTNLEKVINGFSLYKDEKRKMPMEDVVDKMRKRIEIKPSSRGDTFSISFEGDVPGEVVKVTNSLAAKFIEENIKYREERATETSSYTKNELQMAKVVLDKKEDAMREYKLKNYNEMPEQREGNLTRLNSLQQQHQGQQTSIQDLERTKVMVQEQITARKNALTAVSISMNAEGAKESTKGNAEPESEAQQLERLKKSYNSLLIKYTDKHPEAIRIHRIIEKLEQSGGNQKTGSVSGRKGDLVITDPILAQLTIQMKKIDIDVDSLNKEKQQTKNLIKKYEEWIAEAPNREAEWSALTREYGEHKKHYDFLVAQDLQAESVLHLEQKQKGSQFKIEDNARLPEKPFKPNFYKIMGVAITSGLLLGIFLVLGEAFLDSSFKDVEDIETSLGLSVVCSIPFIYTEKEKHREKVMTLGWTLAFIVSVIILGLAFLYFWQHGQIILKFDLVNSNV
jgi:polysaccharide chain length determinant protein (PEP-CTERM system associated)